MTAPATPSLGIPNGPALRRLPAGVSRSPIRTCECGDHAWMALNGAYVGLVDASHAPLLSVWHWRGMNDRSIIRTGRTFHVWTDEGRRSVIQHLASIIFPLPSDLLVDHINGNGLDNRLSNLRAATPSQNAINTPHRTGCTSEYRGVSRSGKYWAAQLSVKNKRVYLGRFLCEHEAARAYDRAALKHHGSFALLNFPNGAAERTRKRVKASMGENRA